MVDQILLKIRVYQLAIKYWLDGDAWADAVEFATRITKPFHREK